MKYVALLRGIGPSNPNMHQDKLCGVLESLGFRNVKAIISSGNVLFESDSQDVPALEARIEEAWPAQLGFSSTTIIRSQEDLQKLVASDPFEGLGHNNKTYLLVTFFKNAPQFGTDSLLGPPKPGVRLLTPHDDALFSVVDTTSAKTPDLMGWLERQFGKEITSRTWKTVLRILDKMS